MSAEAKLELLGLIDRATAGGWSQVRACAVLGVADDRVHRWRARLAERGSLEDHVAGGGAVHRLLGWEEQAILELIERWGPVDRSHRKLAHRGSYTGRVFVSPSTVLRVAERHQLRLPGEPWRARPLASPFPAICWEPNRIWIWDATHFPRAQRVAYAIVDVVSRYWIGFLLTGEQSSSQAQVLFSQALADQRLLAADGSLRHGAETPALVAWSDNGPEMTATDTRQFLAWMTIVQHFGRPHTPTDQAPIESFFAHLKGEWPHLTVIRDPLMLDRELGRVRQEYNTVRLHAAIGYVTPEDEHSGRGPDIRRARIDGLKRARAARIEHNRRSSS